MPYSLMWIASKITEVQRCPPEIANFSEQILSGGRGRRGREDEISLLSQCGSKCYLLIVSFVLKV